MNLQSALGLSLAGVSLICSIGFLMHSPQVREPKPDIPAAPSSYIEKMPSSSGESYRIHHLDAKGKETMIRIKYQDSSDGLLTLGPDGKLTCEAHYFPDGMLRKWASYDVNGVLRSGRELRADRTLLWEAKSDRDESMYFLRVYWPDGKIFQQKKHVFKTQTGESNYYRADGTLWQQTTTVAERLTMVKQFDEQGRPRIIKTRMPKDSPEIKETEIFANAGPWPVMKVEHLKEDGQTDFVQWIAYSARHYWDESMITPNPNPLMLAGVEEFFNGKAIGRYQLDSDQRIRIIEEVHPDGAIRRRHADRKGKIFREDMITPGGLSSQFDYSGALGKVPTVDSRLLIRLTDDFIPTRRFNEGEAVLREAIAEKLLSKEAS